VPFARPVQIAQKSQKANGAEPKVERQPTAGMSLRDATVGLSDFRHIATRYGKLARNYFSSLYLVAAVVFWL
jgi:hypothetical protein